MLDRAPESGHSTEITAFEDALGRIGRDLTATLAIDTALAGGRSGAGVYKGRLVTNAGTTDVVLKTDEGEAGRELAGDALICPHVCVPEKFHWSDDHILYRFIPGATLRDVIWYRQFPNGAAPMAEFAAIHSRMWEQTLTENIPLAGYGEKIDDTKEKLGKMRLRDHAGRVFPVSDLFHDTFVVNGKTVGRLEDIFDQMSEIIRSQNIGAIHHGDELPANVMVDPVSGRMTMLDPYHAGRKAVAEGIAKILLWFDVSASIDLGYEIAKRDNKVFLTTQTGLPPHVVLQGRLARKRLEPWLSTGKEKSIAAAYMMTYYIREGQRLTKYGRGQMTPHILAKALALAPLLGAYRN